MLIEKAPAAVRISLIMLSFANESFACEVRLQHRISYTCPAVVTSPDDCDKVPWGKNGESITSSGSIHIMTSGYSYYCPSHESCIEIKDLAFLGCDLRYLPRLKQESPEYAGHILIGDKKSNEEAEKAFRAAQKKER